MHPWQAELEFVQSLANPEYLHCAPSHSPRALAPHKHSSACPCALADLAQNRYLDDPAFVEHIDYLRYWAGEKYCHYIVFPHCLRMLELLQQPSFRAALKRADFKEMVFRQQHYAWRYRSNPTAPPADAAPPAGSDPLLVSQSETPQVTIPTQ